MIKKTDGMTIVEVIVAFAVLMIGLAGMYKVTLLSGNMVIKASGIQTQVDDLMNRYYKDDLPDTTLAEEIIEIREQTGKTEDDKDTPAVTEFATVVKNAENDEGYHIYYYESPNEGGE